MFTFSAARTIVSVTVAIALTLATGAIQAGTTMRGFNFGARLAYTLEIHVFTVQNTGFMIGRPCRNVGFELYGAPGDPSFFIDSCD